MPLASKSENEMPASREQWLAWSRGKVTAYPAGSTVPQLFRRWVRETPEAVAVIDGEERWTYAELDRRATRVAGFLRSKGVQKGDFVGLPATKSAGYVAGILGILMAGCAYVPIDLSEPEERQAVKRRCCGVVLGGERTGNRLALCTCLHFLARIPGPPLVPYAATSVPGAAASEDEDSTGAAYVLYTSGSTGEPKGVVVPHCGIVRLVCGTDYMAIRPDDVFAFHTNLSFDVSTLELWGALLNGASLVVTATQTVLTPGPLTAHLARHGITFLVLTTAVFNRLAAEAPAMFAGLRILIFGGEAADAVSVRRVLEHGRPEQLINGYGPTEATTIAVCHEFKTLEGDTVPIGRPIANTDALILGPELQPTGEGELHIGGPGLAIGYLNHPQLTAERFIETPYGRLYKTGDLARWLPDGTLEYLGRKDRQMKIRGHRIEPGEIEGAIRRQPGVLDCAVVLKPAPSGEAILVGYVAGEIAVEALREALRQTLPAHMVPAAMVRVERLPLNANGKLDPRALPAPDYEHPELRPGYRAPQTPTERRIAAVWQELLKLPAVGIDDHFFELGGSSLLLLQLRTRLAAALGRELPIVTIFQLPTVRAQAQALEDGPAAPAAAPQSHAAAQDRAAKQRAALARQRLLSKR